MYYMRRECFTGVNFLIKSKDTSEDALEKIFKDVYKKYEKDDSFERFKKALVKKLPKRL